MTQTALKIIVRFWHDDCAEDPCTEDGWKVKSFGRRHHNYTEPEDAGFVYDYDEGIHVPGEELAEKIKNGLAYTLDYFEHGQCAWSLSGEGYQCRWDTARMAGILVWEQDESDLGPVEPDQRREDARRFIERYTEWCNGEIYGYSIDVVRPCHACGKDEEVESSDHDVEDVACGGYYASDVDYMLETLHEQIGSEHEVVFEEEHGYGLADKARDYWKEQRGE